MVSDFGMSRDVYESGAYDNMSGVRDDLSAWIASRSVEDMFNNNLCYNFHRVCCQSVGWRLNLWRIILTMSRPTCEFHIGDIVECVSTAAVAAQFNRFLW